jgi:hypothetical protein
MTVIVLCVEDRACWRINVRVARILVAAPNLNPPNAPNAGDALVVFAQDGFREAIDMTTFEVFWSIYPRRITNNRS